MKLRLIGDRKYVFGKRKDNGNFIIQEFVDKNPDPAKHHYEMIIDTPDEFLFMQEVRHLKKLATARGKRKMISDMCGTSYRAAKEDMGL